MATQAQALRAKEYETIYILRSDVDADTAEKVQGRVTEVVDKSKGKLVKVEAWGRRRLAYPVAKQKKGVYVYVKYVGFGDLVTEIERNLKLQDAVLKFQTVLLKEHVDLGDLKVDPEEIKYQRLELPPEEEKEESRERALGLVDIAEGGPRSRRSEMDDDFEADDMDAPESTATPEKAETSGEGEG